MNTNNIFLNVKGRGIIMIDKSLNKIIMFQK